MKIAGVIPTLDRPADIQRLFSSIGNLQKPDDFEFILFLVDNSAEGNVKDFADGLDCPFSVIYINQKSKGLSHARNAALTQIDSTFNYICTIDDDLVLPESYLLDMQQTIRQYPDAGMIGGRVELYNKQDLPITIKTSQVHDKYASGLKLFGFVHGCCMLFSQEVMAHVGEFDTDLGAGTNCGSAEDTDYYYRIWQTGKDIIYCPSWFVFHNHGRRTSEEHTKLKHNYQVGQGAFYYKQIKSGSKHARKLFYWEAQADLKAWISSFFPAKENTGVKGKQLRQKLTSKWSDRYVGYQNLKQRMQEKFPK